MKNSEMKVGQIYSYTRAIKPETIGVRIVKVTNNPDGTFVAHWQGIKVDWHGTYSTYIPNTPIDRYWKLIEDVP